MTRVRWEYDHRYVDVGEDADFDDVLEELGEQFYELVAVTQETDPDDGGLYLHLFFKRPV